MGGQRIPLGVRHVRGVGHRPKGLNEGVIRAISSRKNEPEFLLEWRLKAYRHWLTMKEPTWPTVCYSRHRLPGHHLLLGAEDRRTVPRSLDEVDPELLETYEKLGIPLQERKRLAGVAVDAVFDSVSVATTFKEKLAEMGIIFCSFSEAVQKHPDLVREVPRHRGALHRQFFCRAELGRLQRRVVLLHPQGRALPDGAVHLFPHQRREHRPVRAHADRGGGRRLCELPGRLHGADARRNQLHAAVVELIALENAEIKYSTVQNWYPGDEKGKGGIYNFVTKRGHVRRERTPRSPGPRWRPARPSPGNTRAASCRATTRWASSTRWRVTNNYQQADTGTKMIHIGKNTRSTIVSKGISAGHGQNSYRGLVKVQKGATNARNFSQCDSLLLGDQCGAHTFPYIEVKNTTAQRGARGVHVEDRRGPDLLLQAARALDAGRGEHDRERLLQGGVPRTADGVRRGGAETAGRQPRRQRGMSGMAAERIDDTRERGTTCWRSRTFTPASRARRS